MSIREVDNKHPEVPYLAQYTKDGDKFVILVLNEEGHSLVLRTDDENYKVGDLETDFNLPDYEPFTGSISLKNS